MLNQNLLLAGDDGYNLTKSLRFRSSASAYLSRTFGTPTNAKKWTYSLWVKGSPWANAKLLAICTSGSSEAQINFTGGQLQINSYNGAGTDYGIRTDAVYRDPSSWYHLVFVYDTDNATSTDRAIIYVNGVRQSVTAPNNGMFPSGYSHLFNTNGAVTYIGARPTFLDGFFDGYIAETNFVDGQALTPSSFGSTNSLTGVWQPAKYTGTYGTNGFYLPFTDTTSTTTLGYDFSGNSNNWTTNNLSLTAGTTYDSMTDVPTLTSATAANYCVLNSIFKAANQPTLSNGNLTVTPVAAAYNASVSTFNVTSGKWYVEILTTGTPNSGESIGIASLTDLNTYVNTATYIGSSATSYGFQPSSGNKTNNASGTAYGSATVSGDIVMLAFDLDNGKIWWGKNGTWFASGSPSAGTNAAFTGITGSNGYSVATVNYSGGLTSMSHNFGQQPFTYTPPTGFVALNTYNLPDSTIVKGNTVMDATLYTGNGTSQSITNAAGYKPDLVWTKSRSNANNHGLIDSVRGISRWLGSNTTSAEDYSVGSYVTAFNSNGFSVGTGGVSNENGQTYVGWQWQAGQGTTSSNTSGSITSTVSVNASAGFSVVTWTGTGSTATIGHGLGVAPKMIIWMHRTNADAYNHGVYHASLPSAAYALQLSLTLAQSSDNNFWNSTAPTSSVFTVGGYNKLSDTMVAYCWAEIAGFSKFGSYTGNGSTDGPFVYTGFRPKFIMIKRSDSSDDWIMMDSSRSTYNVAILTLYANGSYAEDSNVTNRAEDFLSNGFKIRSSPSYLNASGGTYIYMAFAESPFRNSLAR